MHTKVINLYGGPGTGKSTSAALIYAFLKLANKNAELVREYVKNWAWEGRKPGEFDQFYIMGKQMRYESLLYGKVEWIVTDSPVMLSIYYGDKYSPPDVAEGVRHAVDRFYKNAEKSGVEHSHVYLTRSKEYNQAGRYQTEDEAKKIDNHLWNMLKQRDLKFFLSGTRPQQLIDTLEEVGLDSDAIMDITERLVD